MTERVRNVLLAAAILALPAVSFLRWRSDVYEVSYATLGEAAGKAEWLPDAMPASARDIRVRHSADTTERWATFEFDDADRAALHQACPSAQLADMAWPLRYPRWWSKKLASDDTADIEPLMCRVQAEHGRRHGYYALERASTRAWYWTR